MSRRCVECGSADIEIDTARGNAVCTNCGAVLESGIIVSDIQFEENAHGGSSAIGTFVSSETKGGKGVGNTFTASIGRESREITLRNARKKIVSLATQLRLRPDHIDMAFYFFKMALSKHLTRGRKSTHVIAACVYITCRTEGTSHMLIDFSDILQIDVYEIGRTYLRISQALCINIPAMDPCLYVMRFAHKLEFGEKTHEVSMTALRLVSRMKKDWIHFGRRPSGLCGAALLIAGRLHEFNRSITDVIKVVKVHESTLRKRLTEFGETPASQLTLEEFMTADLDAMTEEQDPPSFKAARLRDKELIRLEEEKDDIDNELTRLKVEIEKALEERRNKPKGPYAKFARGRSSSSETSESSDNSEVASPTASDTEENLEERVTAQFLGEETLGIIEQCIDGKVDAEIKSQEQLDYLLMPPPAATPARHNTATPSNRQLVNSPGMGLRKSIDDYLTQSPTTPSEKSEDGEDKDEELDLTGIDEDEIDSYIMSEAEIKLKTKLWLKINAEYLLEQEEKIKKEKLEREELIKAGKDPDKLLKRKMRRKLKATNSQSNGSALEAIEKIVQEKKISTKINYDVLRSLNNSSLIKSDNDASNVSITEASPGEKRPASTSLLTSAAMPSKRIKTEDLVSTSSTSASSTSSSVASRSSRVRPNVAIKATKSVDPGRGRASEPNSSSSRVFNFAAFVRNKSKPNKSQEPVLSSSPSSEASSEASQQTLSSTTTVAAANSQLQPAKGDFDDTLSQDSGIGTQGRPSQDPGLSQDDEGEGGRERIVVEGPDTNGAATEADEAEEVDDEEEDDDDYGQLSAAQLLMRHMAGGDEDGFGEEEDYF